MRRFQVKVRGDLDELGSARLEAAGMPVQPAADAADPPPQPSTTLVRVSAQSEAMARAQVAAVLGVPGDDLMAEPA